MEFTKHSIMSSTIFPFKRQSTVPVWSEKAERISKLVVTFGLVLFASEQFGFMHSPSTPSTLLLHDALNKKGGNEVNFKSMTM